MVFHYGSYDVLQIKRLHNISYRAFLEVGGAQYQRVKIALGADGSAADAVGGTGADSTGVQRVSLATDVALPAGTNAIGKLAANSGVDIGDVDVITVPADPFGVDADAASATGSISG